MHAPAATSLSAELSERLRGEAFVVVRRAVARTLIDDLIDEGPDAVLIVYSAGAFDLPRLCRDVVESVNSGVVVLASWSPGEDVDERLLIEVLDAGAVEIVDVDTSPSLLAARLRVAIRSRPKPVRDQQPIVAGDVVIDQAAHLVSIDGQEVRVRPVQFELLVTLARNAGTVMSRDALLREVWGVAIADVDPRRLRITVSGLRRILGSGPLRPQIESIARFGYRLNVPAQG